MADGKVRLKVNGHVDLNDLRNAVDALTGLLEDLVGHEPVNWEIRHLASGSVSIECEGEAETAEGRQKIEEASREYDLIGETAASGNPLDDYPDDVIAHVAKLTALIRKGGATSVVMSAGDREWTIREPVRINAADAESRVSVPLRTFTRTSIRGMVSTVSDMATQVYFTLEEAHTHTKFKCWAPAEHRNQVWDCGRDRKWITVEGLVHRAAQRGPTISRVTDIFVHEPYEPGDWRKAIGCIS